MPEARDEDDQRFLKIVEEFGWHVTLVGGDEDGPSFAYSTGIFRLTGKPELIVFGLPKEVAHFVVNEYGERLRAGAELSPRSYHDGFLEGHSVTFIEASAPDRDQEYTTWASWFYDRQPFPVLQLVYPDSQTGAFPWQQGYREEWRWHQPLLGDVRLS